MIQLLSPYGKEVVSELRRVYRLDSVAALEDLVRRHLERAYGLADVVLESAHVAYGLAVRLRADGRTYYLKFASRSMNRTPEALFGLVNAWAAHGVPVPQVLLSLNGEVFHNLLPGSDYDVTYLMRALPGGVPVEATEARLVAYARLMARLVAPDREEPRAAGFRRRSVALKLAPPARGCTHAGGIAGAA